MGKCSLCSDLENTRREMEISLMNGSIEKPTWIQTGKPGGGGRRKSKLSESTQKKKLPQRGVGVAQLERLRLQERMKNMTKKNPLHPLSFQNHHFTTLPTTAFGAYTITNSGSTGVGLGQDDFDVQQPILLLQGFGNGSGFHEPVVSSGVGPLFFDETFLADPFAVGSGFRMTGTDPVVSVAAAQEDEEEPEYHDATDDQREAGEKELAMVAISPCPFTLPHITSKL